MSRTRSARRRSPHGSIAITRAGSQWAVTPSGYHCRMSFSRTYLDETLEVVRRIDPATIDRLAEGLGRSRDGGGRLFILGVGGSAGHASHAVNDFRKICGFEAYTPTDNVSELTARINDEGWDSCFSEWLKGSRINANDAVLVFSVGGGNVEKNVSPNLVSAIQLAKQCGASIV